MRVESQEPGLVMTFGTFRSSVLQMLGSGFWVYGSEFGV